MIKIGDFAKIFDVSIKTIRFYEEKGLLKPAYIDLYTGYRYYDDGNIKEMCNILALKDLGFELKEIKNINNEKIREKIKFYEEKISKIIDNINVLKTLSINEGREVNNMKHFINDEDAIGKWQLVGISNTKEDYLKGNIIQDDDFIIDELYLMKGGLNYWVISWTNGIIYINNRENPYQIENDLMFVKLMGLFDDEYKIAVYNKVDNKEYTIDEIKIKDNINIPFERDDEVEGFYQSVAFVNNYNDFNVNNKNYDLPLQKISISPNGDVIVNFTNNLINAKYSKGYIINLIMSDTLCKYELKEIENKKYLFVEWKSGDYVFGKQITGYYVFEKL